MAIEQTGLIPRSLTRTLERFFGELSPTSEEQVIQEFRVSRSQAITSLYYFLRLLLVPFILGFIVFKTTVVPFRELTMVQMSQSGNSTLEHLLIEETTLLEETYYFDNVRNFSLTDQTDKLSQINKSETVKQAEKILVDHLYTEKAKSQALLLATLISFSLFVLLARRDQARLSILRSFLDESLYGLSDATKAFLLILLTDIFVGFHSPKGWEVFLDKALEQFGLSSHTPSVMLFIAVFPVVLDTIFKYWIFRYLNRLSPSAVATYRNMNE
jgi:hypothetical protein|uniref:Chloroplast enveloppe membrane protein n=1 Tax=Pycnococcus provasolii TaxID=41880 RepID=C0JWS2_9CHLO|nr:envelope membrane protein [Pycnococcus provasolii]ACK36791.1 chloroplast enveloppe membrane protein [Pycnococcus provasolii]|mmetsp:Transcript_4493/g.11661  ORF Transcript_4493/g.11661 Transcript_4493/m.11661 type:complete len:271 (+) Transcript_4493:123-935(+)